MKRFEFALDVIAPLLIGYVAVAFANYEINPGQWSSYERCLLIVLATYIAGIRQIFKAR